MLYQTGKKFFAIYNTVILFSRDSTYIKVNLFMDNYKMPKKKESKKILIIIFGKLHERLINEIFKHGSCYIKNINNMFYKY